MEKHAAVLDTFLFSQPLTLKQTSLSIFKFCQHRTKESFVSTANKPLVGILMTIGDVTVSIAILVQML